MQEPHGILTISSRSYTQTVMTQLKRQMSVKGNDKYLKSIAAFLQMQQHAVEVSIVVVVVVVVV